MDTLQRCAQPVWGSQWRLTSETHTWQVDRKQIGSGPVLEGEVASSTASTESVTRAARGSCSYTDRNAGFRYEPMLFKELYL